MSSKQYLSAKVKDTLIREAHKHANDRFGASQILPCGMRTSLDECFEFDEQSNEVIFWFDISSDGITHSSIVIMPLSENTNVR